MNNLGFVETKYRRERDGQIIFLKEIYENNYGRIQVFINGEMVAKVEATDARGITFVKSIGNLYGQRLIDCGYGLDSAKWEDEPVCDDCNDWLSGTYPQDAERK